MSRFDVSSPVFFEWWRANYYSITNEENIKIGRDLEERYPTQTSFNLEVIDDIFNRFVPGAADVLEVGGWKGELASKLIPKYMVSHWLNIDMCLAAIEKTPKISGYAAHFPGRFDWWADTLLPHFFHTYDVFVSAHTIEHLSDLHCLQLLSRISEIPRIILEAPIERTGQTWDGYPGTHILTIGWNVIDRELVARGHQVYPITNTIHYYEKRKP